MNFRLCALAALLYIATFVITSPSFSQPSNYTDAQARDAQICTMQLSGFVKVADDSSRSGAWLFRRKAQENSLSALAKSAPLDPAIGFQQPKNSSDGRAAQVSWMAAVVAAIEPHMKRLSNARDWRFGARVVVFFHVDVSGRVISRDIIVKSGYPDIDALAMRALAAAAPFPPPPPGLERGLYWASTFDGVIPKLHISKK